jgi:uroporphyrinogen III methyltransferase/synthase
MTTGGESRAPRNRDRSPGNRTGGRGKVYLVGAGPGDPGLLTLRGKAILDRCDAIVYDRLAASCLPASLRDGVALYYVGKRADHHAMRQDRINDLLVRLAREGHEVCRLKGGDPFVFGRGGEEAARLSREGIAFEIVPGITAGVAAAAYAGIPVTHRGAAESVTLVTAHEDPTKLESQVDWRCLGGARNGTLAAYMPIGNLEAVAEQLIAGGADPAAPAAVVERGTLPAQRTIVAPLAQLAAEVAAARIQPPALLLVGPTVGLHETLRWFPERPLSGKRVVVTRPADQARRLIGALQELGVTPLVCPAIKTVAADPIALKPFCDQLGRYDWLFFTSENGVRYFFYLLAACDRDVRALAGARIATVGSGTAERLADYRLRADFTPTVFRGDALLAEFRDHSAKEDLTGFRILRVRGDRAPTSLEDGLRAAGAAVDTVLAYHIRPTEVRAEVADTLARDGADAVTFTSGSSVGGFESLLPNHGLHDRASAVCIGPVTAKAAEEAGWRQVVTAAVSTVAGLVACVEETLKSRK